MFFSNCNWVQIPQSTKFRICCISSIQLHNVKESRLIESTPEGSEVHFKGGISSECYILIFHVTFFNNIPEIYKSKSLIFSVLHTARSPQLP